MYHLSALTWNRKLNTAGLCHCHSEQSACFSVETSVKCYSLLIPKKKAESSPLNGMEVSCIFNSAIVGRLCSWAVSMFCFPCPDLTSVASERVRETQCDFWTTGKHFRYSINPIQFSLHYNLSYTTHGPRHNSYTIKTCSFRYKLSKRFPPSDTGLTGISFKARIH